MEYLQDSNITQEGDSGVKKMYRSDQDTDHVRNKFPSRRKILN